jgi:DNA-binding HxlR family transcriptional regulator
MRSYDHFCGLARALDVVGDRWSLLIVRELLLQGPARYTDLQAGLPGIATNLLADRLRDLEQAGVVAREKPTPPVATPLFRLTPWGVELRPAIQALGRWAAPLMTHCGAKDHVRSHWLAMPLETLLVDRAPKKPPVRIELRTDDKPMVLETTDGRVRVRPADGQPADVVLTGTADVIIGLLAERIDLKTARARRLRIDGNSAVLRRVGPRPG